MDPLICGVSWSSCLKQYLADKMDVLDVAYAVDFVVFEVVKLFEEPLEKVLVSPLLIT